MGKYMKKAKITGEVAVMEVPHQSSLGVRTRAKTLALQRLQKASLDSSTSYLQLRSRRLEKKESSRPNPNPKPSLIPRPKASPSPSKKSVVGSIDSGLVGSVFKKKEEIAEAEAEASPESDAGVEVSFGENILEMESRSRSTRETTPCSLIRGSETIGTPGSTTRPTNRAATHRRIQTSTNRNIPTSQEMEEFFAGAEQLQQKTFAEKYNFDPVNDRPLPGRYEWVKLEP